MAEAISITITDEKLLDRIDKTAKEKFRGNRSALIETYVKKALDAGEGD